MTRAKRVNGPRAVLGRIARSPGALSMVFALFGCAVGERTSADADAGTTPSEEMPPLIASNDSSAPSAGGEVFGHSATTLFRLDPDAKTVSIVGDFINCSEQILDIALDERSIMYGAGQTTLYVIDRTTAHCTLVKEGQAYPNSLSFVPAGTVDPAVEALVGFVGSVYYRIDTSTGQKTPIGSLGPGTLFESSGDIVSVKGGGTYVTVKNNGNGCNDCIAEIDPKTGAILKNLGSLGYTDVFGLTFWAGSAYGFTDSGQLFEVSLTSGNVAATQIPIPQAPPGLSFWGAGSTTSAPLTPIY